MSREMKESVYRCARETMPTHVSALLEKRGKRFFKGRDPTDVMTEMCRNGPEIMNNHIGAVSGRRQTYREVLQASHRLACSLQKMGLQPGDLVGIRCGIILEFLVTALGIIRAGCTVLSIKGETVREFKYQLEDAKPAVVFAEPEYCPRILEASKGISDFKGVVAFGDCEGCTPYEELSSESQPQATLKDPVLEPKEAVMVITYSGGTTGPPKGVMLTHYNFVATQIMWDAWTSTLAVANAKVARPVTLDWMPPVHLSGIVTVLGNCLRGCTTVLLSSTKPEDIFAAVEKYRITHMPLMPTRLMMLSNSPLAENYNLTSWTSAGLGGGDVGHFDEDGNVCVVERIKDLIRCIDIHVVPAELEEVLLSHPSVAEAVVVGVPHREFGEAPRAFVILAEDSCLPDGDNDSLVEEMLLHVS
ncbi:hypothetical protein HPB47_006384, partial [Ixodes persulcatus]